ncbi:MAG: Gfo/Idh/MocA family protein [Verrucomicrobiota bacterium JB025]|nr:Gfo/Idh/MocA family oxidoreductase [Verrucomicrobiota bacterium JB025]
MSNNTSLPLPRRSFLKQSAAVSAGAFVLPRFAIGKPGGSANGKVNVAMIGTGGIAGQAYDGTKGENIVALCDVDSKTLAKAKTKQAPDAKTFTDFRKMLDAMGKEIDMVCVNTPDHTHFAATIEAMQRGIHVFTQKPLVHNIWQCRTLLKATEKYKVHTNMGNQGHTFNGIRSMKEWVDAGVFGQIKEAHSWIDGPNWTSRYFGRPELPLKSSPVPQNLDYDLWLGPVPETPYHRLYHPLKWRGFNKFGTGTFGDWFCHVADAPVWVLDLYEPVAIEAIHTEGGSEELVHDAVSVRWDFQKRGTKEPMSFYWHNGMPPKMPEKPKDWTISGKLPKHGTLYLGEKQNGYTDHRSNNPSIVNRDAMRDFKKSGFPEEKYPRVKDGPIRELVDVVKGNLKEAGSNFTYAAPMTEVMLLGILAAQHGGKIEWDAKHPRITNRPELNAFLKEPVRAEWDYGTDLW